MKCGKSCGRSTVEGLRKQRRAEVILDLSCRKGQGLIAAKKKNFMFSFVFLGIVGCHIVIFFYFFYIDVSAL